MSPVVVPLVLQIAVFVWGGVDVWIRYGEYLETGNVVRDGYSWRVFWWRWWRGKRGEKLNGRCHRRVLVPRIRLRLRRLRKEERVRRIELLFRRQQDGRIGQQKRERR